MYKYDLLEVFADKLDCTYDYLLGKSNVPEREYQDMRNETGLSICAIEELKQIYSRGQIDVVNRIFESEKFMERLIGYFEPTEGTKQGWELIQSIIFQSVTPKSTLFCKLSHKYINLLSEIQLNEDF